MFWLYSGNLLFRVLVSLMFLMSEVFYVCFLSYFDPLAIVFVMMTLSFLFFFIKGGKPGIPFYMIRAAWF